MFFHRNDDDSADEAPGNNALLTTAAGSSHDNRLLPSAILRRRLDRLGNHRKRKYSFYDIFILVKKDKRWEGGNMFFHDDSVAAIISHATEQRLKIIIEQIKSIGEQREKLSVRF